MSEKISRGVQSVDNVEPIIRTVPEINNGEINELANKSKGLFKYILNQINGLSNEIFNHFKLGIEPAPKAFRRTRKNRRRRPNYKLH